MKTRVEYNLGQVTPREWSGVYGYKPDTSDDIEFLGVMRLRTDIDSMSLEMFGKLLFEEMQIAFFDESNPERDLVLRLESSAWKMKSKMDLLLSREDEIAKKGLDIEVAVAVVFQNFLYLGVIGESRIYIKRGDDLMDISKALVDGDMNGFLKSGSLEIENEDRFLVTTSKVKENQIFNALNQLDITELETQESGNASILFADESLNWTSGVDVEREIPVDKVDNSDESESIEEAQGRILESEIDEEILDDNLNEEDLSEEEYDELEEVEERTLRERASLILLPIKTKSVQVLSKLKNIRRKEDIEELGEETQTQRISKEIMGEVEEENNEEYLEDDSETTTKRVFDKARDFRNKAGERWTTTISPMIQNNQKTYMKFLKSLASKIGSLLSMVTSKFKTEFIGTGDRREMYKKADSMKRKRRLALLVLIIFGVVLFFGLRGAEESRIEQERIAQSQKTLSDLNSRYENLSSQVVQAASGNDEKKNLILSEFNNLVNDIEAQRRNELIKSDLDELLNKISSSQDTLLSVEAITEPKILVDVGRSFPDANLTDIVFSNGALFISDSARNVIYRTPTNTLDNRPETYITGLVQPYILVRDTSGDIVFYDNDTSSSLGRFGINDPALTRFGQLSPSNIGKPAESVIFDGNGALYELKSNNRQIFKRDKSGDTYVGGGAIPSTDSNTNWRTDSDFTNGIDIAAPYEIYVLISGQGVKRYFSRNDNTITFETFKNFMRNDFESLAKASSFDVTSRYMAVADPQNKRVLMFQIEDNETKDIVYMKQFVYRGSDNLFSDLKEVAINEDERAVYVLDSSKVIKLDF